ncbi:lysophospholipid acyltransferase family protein [Hansschlegelia zhihuaiae]|uniref:1-acyl-sn-glycerol-3-phosphate acyltransferase n=1 Tax=Hansschlegelia zhihuaiae TaxID=405005 RepID=A0A4V1KHX9_9HYPH|nr:lysophospholipid acyltransferase family protein [Hansschlegelia zhihuaiae]RXF68752.1 1-acyl-sn-glycerol-3-phosphate acyltransferase [Hansschlegelia zhihuaiae]
MVRRPFRAVVSALTLIPAVLVLAPFQLLFLRLNSPLAQRLPLRFHRFAMAVVGVRVKVVGELSSDRPLLIAANHASWLDIPVLGSVCPMSFVAKSEIAEWPIFGRLAKMQRTIFVDRARRTATAEVNTEMATRMIAGSPVVLFAEGTSSDGNRVLPFRTSLLGAARAAIAASGGDSVAVQPVSVAYTHRNGLPLGRLGRPFVAWYGDMTFGRHLWSILRDGAIDATVTFGETMRADAATDRKRLAAEAEREVRRLTTNALLGRPPEDVAAQIAGSEGSPHQAEPAL